MLSLTPAAGNELTADPDGGSTFSWTFTSGNSGDSAFNFLAEAETLQLTYTIQSTDSSEALNNTATNTTTVVVTITGTNDTPDITVVDVTGVVTEDTGTSPSGSTAAQVNTCLLYTSPSPRDATLSRMPSSA